MRGVSRALLVMLCVVLFLSVQQYPKYLLQPKVVYDRRRESPKDQVEYASDSNVAQLLKEGLPMTAKIHRLSSDLDTCPHTIVIGYFKTASKHTSEEYLEWTRDFLSIPDCIVIFTSSEMVDVMRKFRSEHAASKTVIVEISVDNLPIAKMGAEFWQRQLDIDPEKHVHKSYQLFWIWLSKSWCVVQAIQQDFFQSRQIFMWQDIGSFRNSGYNGKLYNNNPEVIPPKSLLWMAHRAPNPPPDAIWNNKLDKKEKMHYFHSSSQGAGDASTWLEFHAHYAKTIELFLARNMFIGEDQCVLQATCQLHPELCAYISFDQVQDDYYFGLRHVLANGGKYDIWRWPSVQPTVLKQIAEIRNK